MPVGLNKVFLVGYVGATPKASVSRAGKVVTSFTVGVTISKDLPMEWYRIVTFGKTAEACNKYVTKGQLVHVEGSLKINKWEDKDGNKREGVQIIAYQVLFLKEKVNSLSGGEEELPF